MEAIRSPEIGLSSWSFPWAIGISRGPRLEKRLTAPEILEKAVSLGVSLVQFAENLPLENLPWETVVRMKRYAGEKGLNFEIGTRGTERSHLLKFLELAVFLKSPILRTYPVDAETISDIGELERPILDVLPAYEKEGVTIVLENRESFKAAELAALMQKVNHPNLRVCLDLANALGTLEGPEHVMNTLGPWCGNFQVMDLAVIRSQNLMGFSVEGRPAGKGQIPIRWALKRLQDLGIRHSTILKLWPPWQGDIKSTVRLEAQWVRESLEYLRNLH